MALVGLVRPWTPSCEWRDTMADCTARKISRKKIAETFHLFSASNGQWSGWSIGVGASKVGRWTKNHLSWRICNCNESTRSFDLILARNESKCWSPSTQFPFWVENVTKLGVSDAPVSSAVTCLSTSTHGKMVDIIGWLLNGSVEGLLGPSRSDDAFGRKVAMKREDTSGPTVGPIVTDSTDKV